MSTLIYTIWRNKILAAVDKNPNLQARFVSQHEICQYNLTSGVGSLTIGARDLSCEHLLLRIDPKELLMSQHEYFHHSKAIADVNGIALRALASLVTQSLEHTKRAHTQEEIAADIHISLMNAIKNPDEACFDSVMSSLIEAGVPCEDLSNVHIPAVARALGKAWLNDQMEFANVSIGCARLQGYLRRKGLDWCDTAGLLSPTDLSVLLLVPDFEQHTLGATVLAGQLRAKGINVVTKLHASLDEMENAASKQEFDTIMISSSRSVTIALLCKTVLKLKNSCSGTPLIIGGNVLEQIPDVLTKTGADFTADNWQDALDITVTKAKIRKADQIGHKG